MKRSNRQKNIERSKRVATNKICSQENPENVTTEYQENREDQENHESKKACSELCES